MNDIDRDALIEAAREVYHAAPVDRSSGVSMHTGIEAVVDLAVAYGREQAAQAIEAEYGNVDSRVPTHADTPKVNAWVAGAKAGMRYATDLARGGSTDEEGMSRPGASSPDPRVGPV